MKSDGLRGAPEFLPAITTPENGIVSGTNGQAYQSVLARAGVSPVDLFPSNRIHAWCAGCGGGVARGTGYKHHKIGDKKVYCANCQQGRGFPLRDVDVPATPARAEDGRART